MHLFLLEIRINSLEQRHMLERFMLWIFIKLDFFFFHFSNFWVVGIKKVFPYEETFHVTTLGHVHILERSYLMRDSFFVLWLRRVKKTEIYEKKCNSPIVEVLNNYWCRHKCERHQFHENVNGSILIKGWKK